MRYSITFSYVGAGFCGWQKQPSDPSVQDCLENALSTLLGGDIPVTGAGRTDTDVNAIGYVACFDGPEGLAAEDFRYKLNAILPRGVAVLSISPASPEFHARFDATRREYTYFLHRGKDPFIEKFSWQYGYPDVDFEAMNRAAELLVGTHDFSCFEKAGADNKTSVCTVYEAFWKPYTPSHIQIMGEVAAVPARAAGGSFPARASYGRAMPGPGPFCGTRPGPLPAAEGGKVPSAASHDLAPEAVPESQYWYFRISADRFLRNMVRAVVGTLLEVGRGKRPADSIAELVLPAPAPGTATPKAGTPLRSLAGQSVPGHALFLSKVLY